MKKIFVTKVKEQKIQDLKSRRSKSPEQRLSEVEDLRIQAGKFLYEYPKRFRRIIRITRRSEDKVDVEKLTEI